MATAAEKPNKQHRYHIGQPAFDPANKRIVVGCIRDNAQSCRAVQIITQR